MSLMEMYRAYIASVIRLGRLTAEATELPVLLIFSPHISSQLHQLSSYLYRLQHLLTRHGPRIRTNA
jgi:hypothetical protein